MLSQKRILKGLKWFGITIFSLFIIASLARIPHVLEVKKTAEQVAKIHATKLTLADVMGENLPPDPGAEADKTVAGIDANKNGIRDDVELAIFKEYPGSAKTRAVLLQYALAMQMQAIQPFVNKDIVIAVIQEESRANLCIGDIFSRDNIEIFLREAQKINLFVEGRQLNTTERKSVRKEFLKKIGSYKSLDKICDIDYTNLPN